MSHRPDLFTFVVTNLNYGETQAELSDRLAACVHAARDTGKVATLTLQLKIKPHRSGQYELTEKITAKIPEPETGVTLMYGTPEGNLQRYDPRQSQLDLRAADDPPATDIPLRTVAG